MPTSDSSVTDRDSLGQLVRRIWLGWAQEQSNAKPAWLLSWEELDEGQREVDRRIGEGVARACVSPLLATLKEVGCQDRDAIGHPCPQRWVLPDGWCMVCIALANYQQYGKPDEPRPTR